MQVEKTYLDGLLEGLSDTRMLIEALNKRVSIFESLPPEPESWEYNEKRIIVLKTKAEISILQRNLLEKERYYEKFSAEFKVRTEEMNKGFDSLISFAEMLTKTNPIVAREMLGANWDNINSNLETKVAFYERLKKIVQDIPLQLPKR